MAKDNVAVIDTEKGEAAPMQAFTFPDGGWKAWSTVAGAWLVLFVSFGYVNAFGEPHLFFWRPPRLERSDNALIRLVWC